MPVEITWWGHATAMIRDSGTRVLTDPLFARRLAHLRRRRGPLPAPETVAADAVAVSHLHADHLHPPSLARLAPGTMLLLPRGACAVVPGLRRATRHLAVQEVGPGDRVEAGPLAIRAVPAAHDGRRLPLGRHRSPALGYVVEGESTTYFAGDTGRFSALAEEVGPVDVALLPVGGWGPFLGEGHLDPERAAGVLAELCPSSAVPVHYGTYWPVGLDAIRPHEFHSPGDEFVRWAGRLAPGVRVVPLSHGERVLLAGAE